MNALVIVSRLDHCGALSKSGSLRYSPRSAAPRPYTSEIIFDDNLPPNQSHNLRWIMTTPTSAGVRGMGCQDRGRALGDENRSRCYRNPHVNKLISINTFLTQQPRRQLGDIRRDPPPTIAAIKRTTP